MALASTAKLFNIPVILTTSSDTGPNGPILPELLEILPNATIIRRPGEINAMDNPEFKEAVKKLGRKNLVIAGITTDVCLAFVALSALSDGYNAYAVLDSSGTWDKLIEESAIERMVNAGVTTMSWFTVASELQRDWRAPTGNGLAELFADYLPFYGNLITTHNSLNNTETSNTNHTETSNTGANTTGTNTTGTNTTGTNTTGTNTTGTNNTGA